MPACQVEPLLDGVRGEQHAARHLQLERPTFLGDRVDGLAEPQATELDGAGEVTGHPESTAAGQGDPHALLRRCGKLDRVGEEVGGSGPDLRGQAQPELAVQVRRERPAIGWLEQRAAKEARGALGCSPPIGPLRCGPQGRDRARLTGRLGVQQV